MKEIILTQGYTTIVDDKNYDFLNQWKWFAHKKKNTIYAGRTTSATLGKRKTLYMQNVIKKPRKGYRIDHIDTNGLNNLENNLREGTISQNAINSNVKLNKYKGVSIYKNTIKASISYNGKLKHLGVFKTKEEAANAYDKAAKKYHGEFANLNFKK